MTQQGPTVITQSPTNRAALLVGSLPFASDEDCMKRALKALGPVLHSLPDGEIGEKSPAFPKGNRIAWVVYGVLFPTVRKLSVSNEDYSLVV